MSDSEKNHTESPTPPQLLTRLLRLLLTLAGVGAALMGIFFLTLTIAFAKKEEFFVRGELYAGIAFLVCGIALCTWARRRLSDEIRGWHRHLSARRSAIIPAQFGHVSVSLATRGLTET